MREALQRTYQATPPPRLVVAVGQCACDGGIFGESYASCGAVGNVIPVDATVPGCPPTPTAILQVIVDLVCGGSSRGKPVLASTPLPTPDRSG
jgi:Ni,Fe-hydrogenase III small subunit